MATGKIVMAFLALSTAWAAVPLAAAPRADHPVVRTGLGAVRGDRSDGVESWKGIPYAAPPVGALRWRAPQPASSWRGVRDAGSYSNDCMQLPFPSDAAPLGTTPAEDCLYLNVWRPAGTEKRKLPVLFWIHGGGFVNGGSSPPTYSGAELARQGILVVSINYRLGRFGFFAHPAFASEEPRGLAGNYALLDQVAALGWVRRNIAAFGGDADNITLIGESAGGMSVHMLMTSPLSRGQFRRVIIMSGGDGSVSRNPRAETAQASARAFAAAKVDRKPADVAALRALPADTVADGLNLATLMNSGPTYSGPFVDGWAVVDPGAAYAAGRVDRMPVMIGATSADIGGPDGLMIAGARDLSARLASLGLPVYSYCFSYVAQSLPAKGARHASDIPFFFGTEAIKYGAATTARDRAMGGIIVRYVANFAKTGNPNGADLPDWQPRSAGGQVSMDFAADGVARAGGALCAPPAG